METPASPVHAHHHAVQFYGNDASLFNTVAGFLSEGLVAGQPAIVIATDDHRIAIEQELANRHIDVEGARHIGDLLFLDADETLAGFMVNDLPDLELFTHNVGTVMEQAAVGRTRTPVRAYGEMVDLLWKQGRPDAAIKLEIMWNDLATRYSFSLLCGYSMGNFYKQADQYEAVCKQHTHVIEAESNVVSFERRSAARRTA